MPQRMGRRPPLSSSAWQLHLLDDGLECGLHVMNQQRLPSQGDKDVVVKSAYGRRSFKYRSSPAQAIQRNETALAELGCTDYQPVRRDVVVPEMDGLRNSQSSTSQQREKRAVSLSTQCAVSRLRRQLNDLADLMVRKNVRSRPGPTFFAKDLRRNLMSHPQHERIWRTAEHQPTGERVVLLKVMTAAPTRRPSVRLHNAGLCHRNMRQSFSDSVQRV
jgi:hypothetical protein